jgi:hypothetical protein
MDHHIFQETQLFNWFDTNLFYLHGFQDPGFFSNNLNHLHAFFEEVGYLLFNMICFYPSMKMVVDCFLFFLNHMDFAIFVHFEEHLINDFYFIILFRIFLKSFFLSFLSLYGFYYLYHFVNLLKYAYLSFAQFILTKPIFQSICRFFHFFIKSNFFIDFKICVFFLKLFASMI